MPDRSHAELPPLRPRAIWTVAALLAAAFACALASGQTYWLWPRLLLSGFSLALLVVVSIVAIPALLRRSALRKLFRRGVEFQLTRGGWVFVLSVLLLMGASLNSGNNLLYLLAAALLAALLVSGVVSAMNLSGMTIDFRLPERLFAAAATPVAIRLANEKRWLPGYGLSVRAVGRRSGGMEIEPVYFPYIARRGSVMASTQIRFAARGIYSAGSMALATGFPFGLIRKWRRFQPESHDRPILVYPALQPGAPRLPARAEAGAAALPRPGPGDDLYRIRPHQPGDEARQVHWKATARAGSLRVREFSQERRPQASIVAGWPPGISPEREADISACAALVWELAQRDGLLEFTGYNHAHDLAPPAPAPRKSFFALRRPARNPAPANPPKPFYLPLRPAREHLDSVLRYLALLDLTRPLVTMPPLPANGAISFPAQ